MATSNIAYADNYEIWMAPNLNKMFEPQNLLNKEHAENKQNKYLPVFMRENREVIFKEMHCVNRFRFRAVCI